MGYRYIGSKNKIIQKVIDEIQSQVKIYSTVCDCMTGTGVVAQYLRQKKYKVIATDIMTYSYHHVSVRLLIQAPPKFRKLIKYLEINNKLEEEYAYLYVLNYLNNLKLIKGYFYNEFSKLGKPHNGVKPRNYFTPENAMKIDSIRKVIIEWRDQQLITKEEHSLLLHDLIMATNDIANIAGTYGHYLSKTTKRACEPIILKCSEFINYTDSFKHVVKIGAAENLAESISCDLCYIDPPYIKRQYAANYHVLETIAREDFPEAAGLSGLRPWRDQYSNFCSKIKIFDSFRKIITKMDCQKFLISYSEDGLIHIDKLITFLETFGKVELKSFTHKRFRSNNSELSLTLTEYLIILQTQE